jgi:hypothetical protein
VKQNLEMLPEIARKIQYCRLPRAHRLTRPWYAKIAADFAGEELVNFTMARNRRSKAFSRIPIN